ncbi:MAG: carbohydrate-binding family 9-like protein [Candidatus Latescibacter sp.]|nr:carbohydrate-binding family 9-like protein [Candidatus Latescibacter sp.]
MKTVCSRFLSAIGTMAGFSALGIMTSGGAEISFAADEPELSSYTVTRTTGQITIDGKLDEADWSRAKEFTLTDTNTGKPVPLKSTVKFLWDDQYLYAGFYCEDPDAWATYTKEDDKLWEEEVVELFIDPDGNGSSYYEVEFNPVNARVDLIAINAGPRKNGAIQGWFDWDFKNMKNAVFVKGDGLKEGTTDEFWTVEIAIPFEDLWEQQQIPPKDGDMWRLNAYRIERGKSGKTPQDDWYAAFSPTLRGSFHTPWRFGKVYFKK